MTLISFDLLAQVVGGGTSTSKTEVTGSVLGQSGTVRTESQVTDNAACRAEVKAACDNVNRGWMGVDSAKSGQCFLDNFPKCPK